MNHAKKHRPVQCKHIGFRAHEWEHLKRELLAEAAAVVDLKQDGSSEAQPSGSKVPVKEDPASLSVSGVYFTCPLTGATLTKGEREAHIKEAILMKFAEDPVEASVMMVHTFNKDREKVKAATEVIAKRAKVAHKPSKLDNEPISIGTMHQELCSVASVAGTFFARERVSALSDSVSPSPSLSVSTGTFFARERVSALYEFVRDSLLNDWQPFLLIAPGSQRLTDESLAFNECGLVQCQSVCLPRVLRCSVSLCVSLVDESLAFNECGLVPAALLTLSWDATVQADIEAAGAQNADVLKPELMCSIQTRS
ncbi:UNVERIFIED_CONTAM: hypothetical protein FKN15_005755 [Acipenser sinensis]